MRRLRGTVVSLILGISLFFIFERLDFNQAVNLAVSPASPIGIHTFVYPLGVAAVIAVIVFPVFTRIPLVYSLLLWIGLYLALKLTLVSDRPFFGGVYTYLTLAEAALIALLVALAYGVGRALVDFMNAVEFVTRASGGSKIPKMEQAVNLIQAEVNRSRHYNRSLSVILASLETKEVQVQMPRLVAEAQEKLMQTYLTARLAETIRGELRRMDIVLEDQDNHRVIVISPEVDDWGAGVVRKRLVETVAHQMGIQLQCGAASFPEKALTFEELVREAELDMKQNGIYQNRETEGVAD